ncbi:glutamate racemase [Terrilactibacillus sp. BCM23-1]|uniref:Glutamate racemase n=1 Tax=Terrilactibacillus tamarindi TaxID=2599694 RepID=A0A6N8CNJ4_9BACI|nr:glutamate racemase [Terrilactibacillus tamarindi]
MIVNQPIGVIDSGVGGLTVAKEIMRQLPNEEIVYFGDNLRCPYGPRPFTEVQTYTWQMVRYLLRHHDIKMLVIACNTATAAVYEQIKEALSIPVIGVIHPGARSALKESHTRHIGVIGTVGTINSKAYVHALHDIYKNVVVTDLACPEFVPLVESGDLNSRHTRDVIRERLNLIKHDPKMDTLILGCTHYPLLREVIKDVVGDKIQLIDSGEETAREVSTILYHKNIKRKLETKPHHIFYTTGSPSIMGMIVQNWLALFPEVNTVSLEEIEMIG